MCVHERHSCVIEASFVCYLGIVRALLRFSSVLFRYTPEIICHFFRNNKTDQISDRSVPYKICFRFCINNKKISFYLIASLKTFFLYLRIFFLILYLHTLHATSNYSILLNIFFFILNYIIEIFK